MKAHLIVFARVSASLLGLLLMPPAAAQGGGPDGRPVPFVDDPIIRVGDELALDVQLSDPMLSAQGRGRWYRFDAEQSGTVTIDVMSNEYDVQLAVRDEDNQRIAFAIGGGVVWNAHLELEVEAGRTYRIGALQNSTLPGPLTVSLRAGSHPIPTGLDLVRATIDMRQAVAERAGARGEAARYLDLIRGTGEIAYQYGLYDQARDLLDRTVDLAAEQGDVAVQAKAHGLLGSLHQQLGEPDAAIPELQLALEQSRTAGVSNVELYALDYLANALAELGRRDEALARRREMVAVASSAGDRLNECLARRKLATSLDSMNLDAEARANLDEALDIAEELDVPEQIAAAHLELGNYHYHRYELGAAEDAYRAGLAAAPFGDIRMALVGSLGTIDLDAGRYAEARLAFLDTLAYFEESGNVVNAASARLNLGIVSFRFGDYAAALDEYEQARELYGAVADPVSLCAVYKDIAGAWLELDNPAKEAEALETALRYAVQSGKLEPQAIVLMHQVDLKIRRHQLGEARRLGEQALELAESKTGSRIEGVLLGQLAELDLKEGDDESAIARARQATDILKASGGDAFVASNLGTIAAAAVELKDVELATSALAEAEPYLAVRSHVRLESEELAGLRSRHAPLAEVEQDLIALRLELARGDAGARAAIIEQGFEHASRWKGRALLEGIAQYRRGDRSGPVAKLRDRRAGILADRLELQHKLGQAVREHQPAADLDALQANLSELDEQADELMRQLVAVAPRDAALDAPGGLPAAEVRAALIRDSRVLVDYVEGRNKLYAYVLTAQGLEFVPLGELATVEPEVDAYLAEMNDPSRLGTLEQIVSRGHRLYAALVEPVLAVAPDDLSEVLVVPCGVLSTLPFEALVVQGAGARSFADVTFVLDRWSVDYGPSAPVLVALSRIEPRRATDKLLVLGDPVYPQELPADARVVLRGPPRMGELSRLIGTRDEAVSIASVALDGSDEDPVEREADLGRLRSERSVALTTDRIDVYLGSDASPERLRGDLRGYSIVHCASHGYVDIEDPKMSGLMLAFADDRPGFLPLTDVLELQLDADAAVLSACQTAQGRDLAGEGVQSMARAFMYAGARAVIASLWQVSDRETGAMMSSLYQQHLDGGLPLPESLREAKLALRRGTLELPPDTVRRDVRGGTLHVDPRRAEHVAQGHPYYWAPFIHVGKP